MSREAFLDELLGLSGKTAMILGGGQGIGEGIAMHLARAGANLVLVDMDEAKASKVAAQAAGLGVNALPLSGDVLDDGQLAELVGRADRETGGIDILVCIVGMATFKPSLELEADDWDLDHRRCLRYVFLAAQAFARAAIARSQPGTIVCLSSMSGVRSAAHHAAYGAAKLGLVNLVRTLAVEWAPHGIRINCATPGSISTPNFPDSEETRKVMREGLVPMKRNGTIDEMARPLLFLCSDMSAYMTGANIMVDGGWNAANLF